MSNIDMPTKLTRPEMATYMAKWALIPIAAHAQEHNARDEFNQALIAWQYQEIERLLLFEHLVKAIDAKLSSGWTLELGCRLGFQPPQSAQHD